MPAFNNPIPRPTLPFRHEGSKIRHLRDGDSVGLEWNKARKDNSTFRGQGNALSELQRRVNNLRAPKLQLTEWHPFKIYNVPPRCCENSEDSFRTFRVRAGLVGWRSMFHLASLAGRYSEAAIDVTTGSDRIGTSVFFGGFQNPQNGFQSDIIAMFGQYEGGIESVAVPDTGTAGVTASVDGYAADFVLDDALDNNNERWAEFWIEIVDPNDEDTHDQEVTAEIRCRMTQFGSGTRPGLLVPSANQIPIGIVSVRTNSDAAPTLNDPPLGYRIEQYLYDHVLGRYPIGYYNASLDMDTDYMFTTGGLIYRGAWDDEIDLNWTDTILYNMVFYPGDVVRWVHLGDTTYSEALFVYHDPPNYNVDAPTFGGNSTWKEMIFTQYPI